jgi:hypothetical protein
MIGRPTQESIMKTIYEFPSKVRREVRLVAIRASEHDSAPIGRPSPVKPVLRAVSLVAATTMLFAGFVCAQVTISDPCTSSGVHFSKQLYYLQSGPGSIAPDPRSYPLFQAVTNLGTAPHGTLSSALLHVPTTPERVMDFFHTNIKEQFNSPIELDAAYPQAGNYRIDLTTSSGNGSFQLSFPPEGWPPEPAVINFNAAQTIDPTRDFALQLEPFPGIDTYRMINTLVFGIAPLTIIPLDPLHPCDPISYPHVPQSVIIPKGTLAPNADYFVILTYTRTHVAPNTIGGFTGASDLVKATRLPIRTSDGRNPAFQNIRRQGSKLIFELQVPASTLIVVQTSSSLGNPNWATVLSFPSSTNQIISVTNTITTQPSAAFFRAFAQ